MAKSKVIIRGEKHDDVVFMGYTVTPTGGTPQTIGKFTLRYPHSTAPDFMLMDCSAHKWIAEQAPLRESVALIKAMEGAVIDAQKVLSSQVTITPETMVEITNDQATLERMLAAIQAKLAAKTETTN